MCPINSAPRARAAPPSAPPARRGIASPGLSGRPPHSTFQHQHRAGPVGHIGPGVGHITTSTRRAGAPPVPFSPAWPGPRRLDFQASSTSSTSPSRAELVEHRGQARAVKRFVSIGEVSRAGRAPPRVHQGQEHQAAARLSAPAPARPMCPTEPGRQCSTSSTSPNRPGRQEHARAGREMATCCQARARSPPSRPAPGSISGPVPPAPPGPGVAMCPTSSTSPRAGPPGSVFLHQHPPGRRQIVSTEGRARCVPPADSVSTRRKNPPDSCSILLT